MQASLTRNEVIQNNISNVDTPGFKKQAVEFESVLANAVNMGQSTGTLNLLSVTPSITSPDSELYYRLDGNNVDIDIEMMELYKNSIRYDAYANSVNSIYKRIDMVLGLQ